MQTWSPDDIIGGCELPDSLACVWDILFMAKDGHDFALECLVYLALETESGPPGGFVALLKLAPDVRSMVELDSESVAEMDDAEEFFVSMIRDTAAICMPRIAYLSDIVHAARVRARRAIAVWQRTGMPIRFIDVQLAPYGHWLGDTEPDLIAIVEVLGGNLMPTSKAFHVGKLATLENELADCVEDLRQAFDRRTELAEMGASGTIDRVALNAIAGFGDTATTLRRFSKEWRFWLPDGTALMMSDGHVTAGNGTANAPVQWLDRGVTFRGISISAARLQAAIGRPVTELVQHEFLTPDITVLSAKSSSEHDGTEGVHLKLEIPVLRFCSISGRAWTDDDLTSKESTETKDTEINVIPFRRRKV